MSDTAVKSAKKHSEKPKVEIEVEDKTMIEAKTKGKKKVKAEQAKQAKRAKQAKQAKAKAKAKKVQKAEAKRQKKLAKQLKRQKKLAKQLKRKKIARGFFRRVSRRIARAYKRVTKALARTAKRVGRGTKKGGKKAGKGTKLGVGYVGRAATWTVSAVVNVALAVAAVVTMVVASAVFAVLGGISWLSSGWSTYVLGFFRWMTYREEKISFKKYRAMREAKSQARWDSISSSIEELFTPVEEIEVVEEKKSKGKSKDKSKGKVTEIESIVVPDPEPAPEAPLEVATKSALDDKVSLRVQADLDNAEESFPGAHAEQVASEDPYTAAETKYQPKNTILQTMGGWLGRHPEETPVKFRFVNSWTLDEQAEALQVLAGTAAGMIEKSYWTGRLYAVQELGLDSTKLDAHGKAWAMVHAAHRSQNGKAVSVKHLRAGFMDMVEDLKVQREKAARKPVAS